ncbi:MAG: hypothetical protein O3A47_07690, partial [Chloroflexi bacterium]|nr:hypothetical protein [Chloroflexota bacterium]
LVACGGSGEDSPTPTATTAPAAPATPTPAVVVTPTPTPVPTEVPTPEATPTFTAGSVILPTVVAPTRTPDTGDRFARALDGSGLRMNALRGLSSSGRVEREFLTKDQMDAHLTERFNDNRADIDDDQLLYVTLGAMDREADLFDILLTLGREGILGYYDLEQKKMYILKEDERDLTPADERTYVHEFIHHLQEQHFAIKAALDDRQDDHDASIAYRALLEGDATLAEFIYMNEHFDEEQQSASEPEISPEAEAIVNEAPYLVVRNFVFPYLEGLDFTVDLYLENLFTAVDAAFERPPRSTEQVLHPDKYANDELPVKLAMPELTWVFGEGWSHVRTSTMGEFFIRAYLESSFSAEEAAIAAAGWGGDAYSLFRGPGGQGAIVVAGVWDSDRDAREFHDIFMAFTEDRTGGAWKPSASSADAMTLEMDGQTISTDLDVLQTLVIIGPDENTVDTLRQAVEHGLRLQE